MVHRSLWFLLVIIIMPHSQGLAGAPERSDPHGCEHLRSTWDGLRAIGRDVLAGLNMARRQNGVLELTANAALDRAAQIHAEYMARITAPTARSRGRVTFEDLGVGFPLGPKTGDGDVLVEGCY